MTLPDPHYSNELSLFEDRAELGSNPIGSRTRKLTNCQCLPLAACRLPLAQWRRGAVIPATRLVLLGCWDSQARMFVGN